MADDAGPSSEAAFAAGAALLALDQIVRAEPLLAWRAPPAPGARRRDRLEPPHAPARR